MTNTLLWTYQTGGPVRSSPAIGADGTVYFGSLDGNAYAVWPDGKLRWVRSLGAEITESPALAVDGTVFFKTKDQKLHALDSDGTPKWTQPLGAAGCYGLSSPTIRSDGVVLVGGCGFLHAVMPGPEPSSAWPTAAQLFGEVSSPAISPSGTIVVPAGSYPAMAGYVYELSGNTGTPTWIFMGMTLPAIQSSPAIGANGRIYAASNDSHIYALDLDDGNQLWKLQTIPGDRIQPSPAIGSDGTVYIATTDSKQIIAVEDTGEEGVLKWSFPTGAKEGSSPVVDAKGTVYIGSASSRILALSSISGEPIWQYSTGGPIESSPAIGADGTVFVGCDDGMLYAIGR
jgi:outer membrane protein assembly factor BamB